MSIETPANPARLCEGCGAQLLGHEQRGKLCNRCLDLVSAQFVAVRRVVMRGDARICEAVSSTMARRIANALNRYIPHSRKGY